MKDNNIIAIDGPAASGKSTVSRRVAAALGYLYVDSGALYRAVTLKMLQFGVNALDFPAVAAALPRVAPEFFAADGAVRFRLDGEEPAEQLRSQIVNENVSAVAANPDVRRQVTAWLRRMTEFGSLVMEGRDIGTAVFPDAPFKFYLDADPAERARRRQLEIAARTDGVSVQEVGESLKRRDTIDSGRKTAPLRIAPGAVVVDSTGMTIDDVVRSVLDRLPH